MVGRDVVTESLRYVIGVSKKLEAYSTPTNRNNIAFCKEYTSSSTGFEDDSRSLGSHDNIIMPSDKHSSKKREHSRERNKDRKKRKHKHKKKDEHLAIVDDDPKDEDIWTEKDINLDGEHVVGTDIPTAESLRLRASAVDGPLLDDLPQSESTESKLKRDDWMVELQPKGGDQGLSRLAQNEDSLTEDYGEPSTGARTMSGVDFFSSLGTEHKRRKPHSNRPDPDKARCSTFYTTTLTNQI